MQSLSADIPVRFARLVLFASIGLGAFLMLFRLEAFPLRDYDEATYGSIVRESLERQELTPLTLRGKPWFLKPPLYFSVAYESAKLFGFSEWSLRLPSALFGIFSLLLTYLIALSLTKHRLASVLAVLVLVCNGAFIEAARQVRFETALVFFLLLGVYSFLRGRERPIFLFCIGLSGGAIILTKSLAVILLFPAIGILTLLLWRFSYLKRMWFWLGLIGGFLILVPWHLFMHRAFGGDFWNTYIMDEALHRVTSTIIGKGVTTFTYLKHLLRFAEPWFLFAIALVLYNIKPFWQRPREFFSAHRGAFASLCIASAIFLLFALAQTKLFYYLVPLYPFLAITIGYTLALLITQAKSALERNAGLFGTMILLCIGLASSVYFGFHIDDSLGVNRVAQEEQALGLVLALVPRDTPVYAYNHLYWETIEFYSYGHKVEVLPKPEERAGAYTLILPSAFQASIPGLVTGELKVLYQGPELSLFEVASPHR
ncbi:MAG: phospholipid carrier-dependent glycosyltransferase [Candidatus Taylorbacteria bacterium]|nr:phospholipid carrier-dependent glycosyltransferase [Candidatus Taylorbacteria bacterium]